MPHIENYAQLSILTTIWATLFKHPDNQRQHTLFDRCGFSSKGCYSYYNDCYVRKFKTNKFGLLLLNLLDGVGQVDGFHGDLHFADATEEICDEDASWVPQKKVSTVARSGHTLTLGTYFELGKQT